MARPPQRQLAPSPFLAAIAPDLVKGTDRPFDHHDTNTLKRVEVPTPNPLTIIEKGRPKQA